MDNWVWLIIYFYSIMQLLFLIRKLNKMHEERVSELLEAYEELRIKYRQLHSNKKSIGGD